MKVKRHFAPAAALVLAAVIPATTLADVPRVDPRGKPARILCRNTPGGQPVYAQHADKIIYSITGLLIAIDPQDQAALDAVPRGTALDIKVLDDPSTIADLKGKILSFMRALDTPPARAAIQIIDVDYAMVCPMVAPD